MNLYSAALVAVAVMTALLGLSVFAYRPQGGKNLSFLATTISAALWSLFIAVFLVASDVQTLGVIAIAFYIAAIGIALSYNLFAFSFIDKLKPKVLGLLLFPALVVSVFIAISPGSLIEGVSFQSGAPTVQLNPGFYLLYEIVFVAYFIVAIAVLLINARKTTNRKYRSTLIHILAAYAVTGVIGMVFNMILPGLGDYSLIWVGPLGLFAYAIFIFVAIIRFELFNVKTVMVRLLSYVLILCGVIAVYSLIYNLAFAVFDIENPGWEVYLVNVAMTVFIVALLPLINTLNNFLDRLLHPDGYRIDTIISKLNRTIIKNHDTSKLLINSARLINRALNTRFSSFVILKQPQHMLVAGSPHRAFTDREANVIAEFIASHDERVVFADTLPKDSEASAIMTHHRIAILVQIKYQSDVEDSNTVGYMMIGHKNRDKGFVQRDIELLGATSGLMALAIENASYYQQVRGFNENLRQEITVATSKLRDSNRKLHKLDDAKDEFLSMASHQLRTPLTSIKGYLSMILEGDAGRISAMQRHFLAEAYQSSNNMVRIINDLLSVSRIQTGKFVLDKEDLDLAEIVQEEAGNMVDSVVSRDLKIAVKVEDGDYHMSADDLKVRQIVNNLIDNALYYSDSGGTISVILSHEDKKTVFKVVDTGIGVPKSELPNLFTKFSRASNAKKRRPDGTGVGLFLVKKVAKAHGGDVFVKSEEGKGSTFGFWLPA